MELTDSVKKLLNETRDQLKGEAALHGING